MLFVKNILKHILPRPAWERFRDKWKHYLQPLNVDYCPVRLPWFASTRRADEIGELHQLAMSFNWLNERSVLTTICVAVGAICWPFQFLIACGKVFHRFSGYVKRTYQISRLTQFCGLIRLGVGSNVPPLYYYKFRLFKPEKAVNASAFIFAEEMAMLHAMLMNKLPPETPLSRKELFFEHALLYGLPTTNTIATFVDGNVLKWYGTREHSLPACDLVIKPVDEGSGYGFELWSYNDESLTWRRGEKVLDAAAFIQHCCSLTTQGHMHILQQRLVNHSMLLPISGRGLSTIRIVTYRTVDGNVGVIVACLRMATGASHVDNFEVGGIAAPVDLATGVLGVAVAKDIRCGTFTHHPDTHGQIEGLTLPYFAEALDLTQRAQSCFPWVPFVGWDVVITDNGPLLLEANPYFGIELPQIVIGQPLGLTQFPAIYLQHIAAQKHLLKDKV